jgi:hypothetical protein
MTATEMEIAETVDQVVGDWISTEMARSQREYRRYVNEIDRFKAWLHSYGLTLPVSGRVVAGYLLELAADGASLPELRRAANAIRFYHDVTLHAYLDSRPIRAVLTLAAAQTSPNRVLN